jgi:hypothetical protein
MRRTELVKVGGVELPVVEGNHGGAKPLLPKCSSKKRSRRAVDVFILILDAPATVRAPPVMLFRRAFVATLIALVCREGFGGPFSRRLCNDTGPPQLQG